jgi:CHAT domain-containing protein
MANTLSNLGETHAELGEYRRALEFHNEALSLRRAVRDPDGEARSLNSLGKVYAKLGEREKARDHCGRAAAIFRASGSRRQLSATLRNLGSLHLETHDLQAAFAYLQEALEIGRAIHDRRSEVDTLSVLARLERDRGDLPKAHERAAEALAALESLRLTVTSPSLRASFFASARDVQELDIGVLMRLHALHPDRGFAAAALLGSERGRARSLLEMLGESGAGIRRGVDAALIERELELEQIISGKAERRTRMLSGKYTAADVAAASRELDALTAELEQIQSRIRETSPQYAALTQPAPLSLKEIQTKVLDEDTVLLEYALGTEKSYLWVVMPSSAEVFELPPRNEIESSARKAYELLTARNQNPAKESPAARTARVVQADAAYFAAAAKASAMLLGPAASRIANKRLLIVGEGMLQYLPFGALPEPAADVAGAVKPSPLILSHEIVTAPSASVMAVLRQETAGRKPAQNSVAVLADPVFSADDARIAEQKSADRARAGLSAQDFVRLRFSRTEAEEIARLAPAGTTFKALDFDASRDTVLKAGLEQYRIVHFATHSLLDNEHPELSGVVLSLVDRTGRPQNGFLRLYDIYNLHLASDLVVLSACRTALGVQIRGEGLIGLTRGFLYAGAARVVATLWEIDDRTTAEVMRRFYQGMLGNGERPAAALRAAQSAMWKTKGWDAPYYWAAFILQGEWR